MKTYQRIDDAIMKRVNNGVMAWNWTTGKTKADLANLLDVSGTTLTILGLNQKDPGLGSVASPLFVGHSLLTYLKNKGMDKLEQEALKTETIHTDVEYYKNSNRFFGPTLLSIGTALGSITLLSNNLNEQISSGMVGTGFVLKGLSNYVMRADYLPPAKNIFQRAKDKYQKMSETRSLIPAPSPTYRETLEAKNA